MFFYRLPKTYDPDQDIVTVEMITDLSQLKFLTFMPDQGMFQITGLTNDTQGQY